MAASATGEDIQMLDGAGESMKDVTIEEDQRVEEREKEIEEEQELEATSTHQLKESITDKEQVQSDVIATVMWCKNILMGITHMLHSLEELEIAVGHWPFSK